MHTYLFIRFNDSDTSGNSWQSLPLRELVLRLDAFAGMLALLLGAASVQELQQHAGWIAAGLGPVLAQSLPGMLALGQVREVSLCLLRLSPAGVLAFVEQHQVAFAGVLALGELGLLQHHLLQRQPLPGVLPPHPAAVLLLLLPRVYQDAVSSGGQMPRPRSRRRRVYRGAVACPGAVSSPASPCALLERDRGVKHAPELLQLWEHF